MTSMAIAAAYITAPWRARVRLDMKIGIALRSRSMGAASAAGRTRPIARPGASHVCTRSDVTSSRLETMPLGKLDG